MHPGRTPRLPIHHSRKAMGTLSRSGLFLLCWALLMPSLAPAQQLRVDTRDVREPISPYIYGQFIEHLGRCIYGGLWAEMLEDRKFYFPVTGEAPAWELFKPGDASWTGEGHPYELLVRSPWMVLGDRSAVNMVREGAFVGEHTPEIRLPGNGARAGLYQERLSLEKGRTYDLRVVLAGDPGAGPVEVSLVWGGGAGDRRTLQVEALSSAYATREFSFTAGGTTDRGVLEIVARGNGSFRIGTVSLMPADNVYGWRPEVVALLKELDSPVYRWPGGNFVSGYDWHDGIGDRDKRPPRKNPAWTGIEHNDVGLHEFMDLMALIDSEPFVAVNTGLGGAEEAANLVAYANSPADSEMGSKRAANGRSRPFDIRWWAIGNEMYGDWQLGHMPLAEYVLKHNQVVDAMRAVDPNIRPIAVGAVGDWSRQMMTSCSDHMDLLSEHLYWQDRDDLIAHIQEPVRTIRSVADAHRTYRRELPSLAGKDIRIALDEWNYWYGPNEYGELGVRYFLQDALGLAAGLHELFRNSDIFYMANYAQTVNVIGAIKTTQTKAEFEPTGLVLRLYRRHFGTIPVAVSTDMAALDVSAALSTDGRKLTIAVMNPTEQDRSLGLDIAGDTPAGSARRWVLTGADRFAGNRPGEPRGVDVTDRMLSGPLDRLDVPRLSVTLFEIPLQ